MCKKNKTRLKGNSSSVGSVVRIGAPVAGTVVGTAISPVFGGIIGGIIGSTFAEVYTNVAESEFIERRLKTIEDCIGIDVEVFKENIINLTEHEHYALKRIIKFHCFEAMPELTPTTAKIIINYVIDQGKRTNHEQTIEILCQLNAFDYDVLKNIKRIVHKNYGGNYSQVFEWKDFSPVRQKTKEGEEIGQPLSDMISIIAVDENDIESPAVTTFLNATAISYGKLDQLNIISSWHKIYSGMNTDADIDQFTITSLGKKIIDYIDLEDDQK